MNILRSSNLCRHTKMPVCPNEGTVTKFKYIIAVHIIIILLRWRRRRRVCHLYYCIVVAVCMIVWLHDCIIALFIIIILLRWRRRRRRAWNCINVLFVSFCGWTTALVWIEVVSGNCTAYYCCMMYNIICV